MIPNDLFEEYKRALDTNSQLVQQVVSAYVGSTLSSGFSSDAIYKNAATVYAQIVQEYGSYASAVAVEFYEQLRQIANIGTRYEPQQFYPDNNGLLAYDVSTALKYGEQQKVIDYLMGSSNQRVFEYADETLIGNALSDPAKPKWALVPNSQACSWCRMLGSNGFMYANQARVNSSRHPHCKCTPIVDFSPNPKLDGYDPGALYDEYKYAYDLAKDTAWDEWESLSKEEQDKYKRKGRSAFDVYLRNKTLSIMNSIQ